MREWQGRTYEVVVLDDGFSWAGHPVQTRCPPIARKITGTGVGRGPLFFGTETKTDWQGAGHRKGRRRSGGTMEDSHAAGVTPKPQAAAAI